MWLLGLGLCIVSWEYMGGEGRSRKGGEGKVDIGCR